MDWSHKKMHHYLEWKYFALLPSLLNLYFKQLQQLIAFRFDIICFKMLKTVLQNK